MATLISPEQARNIGHAVIDVREFPEYAAGAIKGSRLVPLSTVEREASKWNKTEPVLLVCRSGKRAAQAADILERLGFQNVNVLQGGFEAWKAAGLPSHMEEHKPWSLERQVRASAGGMVLLFTVLGLVFSPWFLALTLFVGAGLLFAGVMDVCLMATALGKLPWNRSSGAACKINRKHRGGPWTQRNDGRGHPAQNTVLAAGALAGASATPALIGAGLVKERVALAGNDKAVSEVKP